MKMPRIGGLSGRKPRGPGQADNPLDELDDEQFESLQQLAEAAAAEEGGEAAETPAEEAAEGAEEQAAEKAEGREMHDAPTLASIAQAASEEAAGYARQIEELIDKAKQSDNGDPKAVKGLAREAARLVKQCEKLADKAVKAANKEDVGGAAEAAAECDELCKEVESLLHEAKQEAGTMMVPVPVADADLDAPGIPPGIAPASGSSPKGSPWMTWAQRAR
jgi:hypothetical protein